MTDTPQPTLAEQIGVLEQMLACIGEPDISDHDLAMIFVSGEMEVRAVLATFQRVEALEKALRKIANINNGPDRASGEWRRQEASAIALAALNASS